MIVKNEEWVLGRTLPNLVKHLDEVIVVDTGSTDRTVEIAQELGAKVFHFAWINDFSAARNESLKHATGDWILWIDADEFMKEEDLLALKGFLGQASNDSYQLELRECELDKYEFSNFYVRVKLFRNGRGSHFERPINEQVCAADGKVAGGDLIPNIYIYHWGGRVSAEKKQQKKERNIELLSQAAEKNPKDPAYRFLLANNFKEMGMLEQAIKEFEQAIATDPKGYLAASAHAAQAWCHYKNKNGMEAFKSARRALELDQNLPDAYNLIGIILGGAGKYDEALQVLDEVGKLDTSAAVTKNISMRQYKYTPFLYRGLIYDMAGQKEKAREAYLKAAEYEMTDELKEKLNGR